MRLHWRRQLWDFRHLINFVNQSLDKDDWEAKLKLADLWQAPDLPANANTWDEALSELQKPTWKLPTVHGKVPDFSKALRLQEDLRKRLEHLAKSKPVRIEVEKNPLGRSGRWGYLHPVNSLDSADKGRLATVYPSGGVEFDDAADGLEFLVDALQHELDSGAYQYRGMRGRRWTIRPLRLSICECGCGTFFLWEGNGIRRRRKYVDDKHRMDFHNARNVEKKKLLACQRRAEFDQRYF